MAPRALSLLTLAAGLGAAAGPLPGSRAEACSPPLPTILGARPSDGAVDVPTNARIWIQGFGLDGLRVTLSTVDARWEVPAAPLVSGLWVADPGGLPANEAITVIVNAEPQGATPGMSYELRTGSAEDRLPPDPVAARFEARWSEATPCGAEGWVISARAGPGRDDHGLAALVAVERRVPEGDQRVTGRLWSDDERERGLGWAAGRDEATRCYTLVAFDLAGNFAEPPGGDCLELRRPGPDAGVLDAGAEADAGTTADASGADLDVGPRPDATPRPDAASESGGGALRTTTPGCGCASLPTPLDRPAPVLGLLGLGLALGLRRRRRTGGL